MFLLFDLLLCLRIRCPFIIKKNIQIDVNHVIEIQGQIPIDLAFKYDANTLFLIYLKNIPNTSKAFKFFYSNTSEMCV